MSRIGWVRDDPDFVTCRVLTHLDLCPRPAEHWYVIAGNGPTARCGRHRIVGSMRDVILPREMTREELLVEVVMSL